MLKRTSLLCLFALIVTSASAGFVVKQKKTIYVLSIGVNDYSSNQYAYKFANCVNDAEAFARLLQETHEQQKAVDRVTPPMAHKKGAHMIDTVIAHVLLDKEATLANIREAFLEIITKAKPNDMFFFYFAGITREVSPTNTVLVPYVSDPWKEDSINLDHVISVAELSGFMEQLDCEDQMIISESGVGKSFAMNLISHLFESNPHVAKFSRRNRLILTTHDYGFDSHRCNGKKVNHGPLTSYILESKSILSAFNDPHKFEFELNKAELECPVAERTYFNLFIEKEFTQLLVQNQRAIGTRGGKTQKTADSEVDSNKNESKLYALIVGTNEYENNALWDNLENPLNDAISVQNILRDRYGAETHLVVNKTYDEFMDELDSVALKLDTNDRLLFFIAGHGYYRSKDRSGYLVFKDSKPFEQDPTLRHSYMHMATLRHQLTYLPCRQVFAIFDVCFGAQFDPAGEELRLNDYRDVELDIDIEKFVERKCKHPSRIFLASGKYEVFDYWNNSADHSPFAKKLLKAMREEKGFISPGKLYNRLEGNATEPVLRSFAGHEPKADFLLQVIEKAEQEEDGGGMR